jgi:hypothetical protein
MSGAWLGPNGEVRHAGADRVLRAVSQWGALADARRRWELRLRWRRTHARQPNDDLLRARLTDERLRVRNLVTPLARRALDYYFIAGPEHRGPRGVLP